MEFLRTHLSKIIVGIIFMCLGLFYYKSSTPNKNSDPKKENVNFKVSSDSANNQKSDTCSVDNIEEKSISEGGLIDEQKIKFIVKNYIENNPEIIIASLEKYQRDKEVDIDAESQKRILEKKDDIDSIKKDSNAYIGKKDSNKTIMVFLDYNCDYCKRAGSVMNELIELDPNIKVLIQQYPILDSTSLAISKIVTYVAKNSPDRFLSVHEEMITIKNPTEQDLREYVFKNNIGSFDEIMDNQEVNDSIEYSKKLGNYLGIRGVPGFIIQDKLIPGLISIEQIRELIKDKGPQQN